jgi:hypothetical protein
MLMFSYFCVADRGLTVLAMKETPRRRRTVTSSLNEISTDQLGKRVVLGGGRCFRPAHAPLKGLTDRYKDDLNGFFLHLGYLLHGTRSVVLFQ